MARTEGWELTVVSAGGRDFCQRSLDFSLLLLQPKCPWMLFLKGAYREKGKSAKITHVPFMEILHWMHVKNFVIVNLKQKSCFKIVIEITGILGIRKSGAEVRIMCGIMSKGFFLSLLLSHWLHSFGGRQRERRAFCCLWRRSQTYSKCVFLYCKQYIPVVLPYEKE